MQWYYGQDGRQQGPVSIEALRQLLAEGALPQDALVWREGMSDWLPASQVSELAGRSAASLPPPAPPPPAPPALASPLVAGVPQQEAPVGRRRPWPLTVVSLLWLVKGGLLALGGLVLAVLSFSEPKLDGLFILALLLAALGLLVLASGLGLWRLTGWGRALAFVWAVLSLLGFPLGTIFGCVLIAYLISPGVKALFDERPPEALSASERQALRELPSSGLGTAVGVVPLVSLVLSFFILPVIAAIAIPNFLNALQRGKQKRTMADIRLIATAVESYSIDNQSYPAPDGPTVAALEPLLVPTYVKVLPTTDGWESAFVYETDADREGYRIGSFGKDGIESGPAEGPIVDFRHDILFENGSFVTWPDVAQGRPMD